mgnify:CR=1 FL=1
MPAATVACDETLRPQSIGLKNTMRKISRALGAALILGALAGFASAAPAIQVLGRDFSTFETAEDEPCSGADVDRLLHADPAITHVALIHCETSTGLLNPLPQIAQVVKEHGKRLIVDAIPATANGRVTLSNYPGGHMFYSRPDSGAAFRADVKKLYGAP